MTLHLAQFPSATAACASGAGCFVCTPMIVSDLESSPTNRCQFPGTPNGPVKILAILGETLIAVREDSLLLRCHLGMR